MITTIPTMQTNKNGKQWDTASPFRLVVVATKGDKKGEIIERCVRVIGWKTLDDAKKEQNKILEIAASLQGDFASYGITCIVNEETGEVLEVKHIA